LPSHSSLRQKTTDTVRAAVDRLTSKPVFSYGISDKSNGLTVKKPDGTSGIVSWNYLRKSIGPFAAEFSSGSGIHEHNKFVVTDFSLPTAKSSRVLPICLKAAKRQMAITSS